jgi:hypothetical protein
MSSHPNVFLGAAYWVRVDGGHPAFVLSDPAETGGETLFIRFTTYVPDKHKNCEVFTKEDYNALSHDSVVAYYGSKAPQATAVQSGVSDGYFELIEPLPPLVIQRIVDEAKTHRDFAPKLLKLLPSSRHPSCHDDS